MLGFYKMNLAFIFTANCYV